MTREEQIENAAFDYNLTTTDESDAAMRGFSAGAEWADANRWVSVKDGLPETGQKCYCITDKGTKYEDEYQEHKGGIKGFLFHNVTHWQPLPEPPKADQ